MRSRGWAQAGGVEELPPSSQTCLSIAMQSESLPRTERAGYAYCSLLLPHPECKGQFIAFSYYCYTSCRRCFLCPP